MSSENICDVEDLKLLLSHSRHQIVILKTELLHNIQLSEREQKELKHSFSLKVSELECEFQKLEEEKSSALEKSLQEQKCLEQRNLQLNQKVKMLEDELNTIQQDRDLERERTFQLSEQVKSTAVEKHESLGMLKASNDQLKEKIVTLEAELDQSKTHCHELEITLNSERHQTKMMKSRIDEVEQQFEIDQNSAAKDIEKYKNEIQTLKISSQNCKEELQRKLEMEKKTYDEAVEKHLRLQREMEKKISDLKENHLLESQQLLQENDQLLNRIQVLEKALKGIAVSQEEPSDQAINMKEKIQELNVSTKDKLLLESKSRECEELRDQLLKEKGISTHLRQEVGEVISQLKKFQKENLVLRTLNEDLDKSVSDKEKVSSELMKELKKERSSYQQKVNDAKSKGEDLITEQKSRISYLESHLAKKAADFLRESSMQREKIKQYGALIKKLRFRLEASGVKEKELEARMEVWKQEFVPSFRYRQLQQNLQQIINKHTEFRAFIQGLGGKQDSYNQMEELSSRMNVISEKLLELDSNQKEAYAALEEL